MKADDHPEEREREREREITARENVSAFILCESIRYYINCT
jgi:hypothetical protein